jgi:hypothetical protein
MVRSVQVGISLQSGNDWSRPAQFCFVVTWLVTVISRSHTARTITINRPQGS